MDWERAIRQGRGELLRLVLWMLVRAGSGVVSKDVHLELLRMVRVAESGFRRLVVMAARGVTVRLVPTRRGPGPGVVERQRTALRRPPVPLFDRRKRFGAAGIGRAGDPRVTVIGLDDWQGRTVAEGAVERELNPLRLRHRLLALQAGLDDVPKHVLRLARCRARRAQTTARGGKALPISPMRPGWPPGYRINRQEAVHEMLLGLDSLARRADAAAVAR